MSCLVETVTMEEDLEALREDWDRLSGTAKQKNAFSTFEWFRVWNRALTLQNRSGERRLSILVLKDCGAVLGIAPLIYRASSLFGATVRKIEFLESGADYNDLVVGPNAEGQVEAVVHFLWQAKNDWDVVNLGYLRLNENLRAKLEAAILRTGLPYSLIPEERCPYMKLDRPLSDIVGKLSSSARQTIRNMQSRMRRMSADGLCIRIIDNPQDEPGLVEKLIAIPDRKRGKSEPIPFIPKYPESFESLFKTLGRQGWIFVALMEMNDRPLAFQLGFRCGEVLWNYLSGHDPSFSRISPGTLLTLAVIDYGYVNGYTEYDFLSQEKPFKTRWSTGYHQTFRLRIWSKQWVSWVHRAKDAVPLLSSRSLTEPSGL
jgi:CelD/BcsL family acetyltransferase involved in cellulose biosynthesis